jgi:hypothetical protein
MRKIYGLLLVWVLLFLPSCGPGKLFGPTLTPSPTITQTPTRTQTPTVTRTPTPTHPRYFEGFANYDNPNIPIIRKEYIPALLAYLKTQPSHLQSNAETIIVGDIMGDRTDAHIFLGAHPGSLALVATVKVEATIATNEGPRVIHPMYQYWEMMTPDGPRFIVVYAYDEVQANGPMGLARMARVALPPPDATFSKTVLLELYFAITEVPPIHTYYLGILAQPEYAHFYDLVEEWFTTGTMSPELEQLIFFESGFVSK